MRMLCFILLYILHAIEPKVDVHCRFLFWRYLTRGLIWHLSQSSIRPSIYFSSIVNSRSNPVLSNKGKVSCSRKQRGPLMGLEPMTSTSRRGRATHRATPPILEEITLNYIEYLQTLNTALYWYLLWTILHLQRRTLLYLNQTCIHAYLICFRDLNIKLSIDLESFIINNCRRYHSLSASEEYVCKTTNLAKWSKRLCYVRDIVLARRH